MKLMYLFACLPSIVLAVGGIILALHGIPNWGWVIFASLCTIPSFHSDD